MFTIALVAIIAVLLNLPVTSITVGELSDQAYLGRLDEPIAASVTRIGFPWTFHSASECSGAVVTETSFLAATGNAAALLVIVALVLVWLNQRSRIRSGRFSVARFPGTAVATTAAVSIAAVFATSHAWRFSQQEQAIVALGDRAEVVRTVLMPSNLAHRVPRAMRWSWETVQNAELRKFDSVDLTHLSNFPSLSVLRLSGGRLDDADMAAIARLKSLRLLVLARVDLTALSAASVKHCASLTSLSLRECEPSDAVVDAIVALPHLRELGVVDSAEIVSRVSRNVSGTSLENLELVIRSSREPLVSQRGEHVKLSIALTDAAQLKYFSVNASRPFHLDLALADLPKLSVLGLSTTNLVSLAAENLPRWNHIAIIGVDEQQAGDYESDISPLFDRLKLVKCLSLGSIRVHSRFIQSIEIKDAPSLTRLSLDRWETAVRVPSDDSPQLQSDEARFTKLIDQISRIESLRQLELLNLDLSSVQISPLEKLARLNRLDVTGCTLESQQVIGLQAIEKLDCLTLVQTGTGQAVVDTLLGGSNRWRKLQINASAFHQLRLVNQYQLTHFFSQNYFQANHVTIVNAPVLEGELRLTRNVDSLRIENAPRLRGISVTSDLPANTHISGVRDLQVFEAGGPGVSDTVLASVSECTDLKKLLLRSGNVSRDTLPMLAKLNRLDSLHLPGMPVDDAIVLQWESMTFLRDIILDSTEIGPESIRFFAKMQNLQRLSIAHTHLTPDDLRPLGDAETLMHLSVAGVGIHPETLLDIAQSGFLHYLDLSDIAVSDELLDALASEQLKKLSILKLKDSGLSPVQLARLAAANPKLVFEAPRSEFDRAFYETLAKDERIIRGRSFTDRLARSGAAGDVLMELPYGRTEFEETRMTDYLERRSAYTSQDNL